MKANFYLLIDVDFHLHMWGPKEQRFSHGLARWHVASP